MMTRNAGSGSASKRTTALRSRGAMLLQLSTVAGAARGKQTEAEALCLQMPRQRRPKTPRSCAADASRRHDMVVGKSMH
jgi:hypothetical protein